MLVAVALQFPTIPGSPPNPTRHQEQHSYISARGFHMQQQHSYKLKRAVHRNVTLNAQGLPQPPSFDMPTSPSVSVYCCIRTLSIYTNQHNSLCPELPIHSDHSSNGPMEANKNKSIQASSGRHRTTVATVTATKRTLPRKLQCCRVDLLTPPADISFFEAHLLLYSAPLFPHTKSPRHGRDLQPQSPVTNN